ncbi:MAG TPA: hypothetical protein P5089_02125 [Candidatus Portnoybacteria bacterium]|nr:hypothetical protein [Candidatus Portnoybacteria bacterium]
MKIPVVASGVDFHQAPPVFLAGQEKVSFFNSYLRECKNIFQKIFKNKYRNTIYDLNIEKLGADDLPDIVFPLTFIDYDHKREIKKLSDKKIFDANKLDPLDTNCSALSLFNYLSYKKFKTALSVSFIAREIRQTGKYTNFFDQKKHDKGFYFSFIKEWIKLMDLIIKNKIRSDNHQKIKKECPFLYKNFNQSQLDKIIKKINGSLGYIKYFKINLKNFT